MKLLITLLMLSVTTSTLAGTYVKGYVKKDGTYVEPHYRSSPDSSKFNNYSTEGNVNPYNGKEGHVDPYYTPPPTYQYSPPSYQYQDPYNPNN